MNCLETQVQYAMISSSLAVFVTQREMGTRQVVQEMLLNTQD